MTSASLEFSAELNKSDAYFVSPPDARRLPPNYQPRHRVSSLRCLPRKLCSDRLPLASWHPRLEAAPLPSPPITQPATVRPPTEPRLIVSLPCLSRTSCPSRFVPQHNYNYHTSLFFPGVPGAVSSSFPHVQFPQVSAPGFLSRCSRL